MPTDLYRFRPAYLYILGLDRLSVALEFKRRAVAVNEAFLSLPTAQEVGPNERDADQEEFELSAPILRLARGGVEAGNLVFDLWKLPGRKRIFHLGSELVLTLDCEERTFRITLDLDICAGEMAAHLIERDHRLSVRLNAVRQFEQRCKDARPTRAIARRPRARDLFYMHALIALDAHLGGLSYRQIAVALFGEQRVRVRWRVDESLKSQIRYLVQEARTLMAGGYRRLTK